MIMTSEERAVNWMAVNIDHDTDDSVCDDMVKTLAAMLDYHAEEQRETCAANVKAEGYRKNHVPTVHDYVQACLNATGENNERR